MKKKSLIRMIAPIVIICLMLTGCSGETTNRPEIQPSPTSELDTQQSPAAKKTPPLISGLLDKYVTDGDQFESIDLEEFITDEDNTPDEVSWKISGQEQLVINLEDGILVVSAPGIGWTGSEVLIFEACDPSGICDVKEVVFEVEEIPSLSVAINDQAILPGERFNEFSLYDSVSDIDQNDTEITWSYAGNAQLEIDIIENIVQILPPDPTWTGAETIRFEACDTAGVCGFDEVLFWVMGETDEEIKITYVGNTGFLIVAGDEKILIDALFLGNPNGYTLPEDVLNAVMNGEPPFDDIDLILVTHDHDDHFSAELVASFLENNPNTILVSTSTVKRLIRGIDELLLDQVISIKLTESPTTQMVVGEVGLETIKLLHGDDGPKNIGFIITVAGKRLFHTGDFGVGDSYEMLDYIQTYDLPRKRIDVGFVQSFMLTAEFYKPVVTEGIQPQYIIPMHWAYGGTGVFSMIAEYFTNVIFFYEELDSWILPND